MVPRHLLALTLALVLDPYTRPWTYATTTQPGLFLADTTLRRDQVQDVLEHTPVKEPACQQFVRRLLLEMTSQRAY